MKLPFQLRSSENPNAAAIDIGTKRAALVGKGSELEAAVKSLADRVDDDLTRVRTARFLGKPHNTPSFDVRVALPGGANTDRTQIHGLGPSLAPKLVAECGPDLRARKSARPFTSWLCLAPGQQALRRQAAVRADTPIHQSGRRTTAPHGSPN